jgi:hypothetical protein
MASKRLEMLVKRLAGVAIIFVLVVPIDAFGADPIGSFSISPRLGVSGFDMGAINDGIDRSNDRLELIHPEWDVPKPIHVGFDFMADAAYDLSNTLRIGLIYQTTQGSTGKDFLQSISIEPKTSMIIPRAFVRVPFRPMIDMSLRLFAGPVFLTNAKTTIEHENTSDAEPRVDSMTLKHSGTGWIAGILSEYTLSDRFTLCFEGGYRSATAELDEGSWKIDGLADPRANPDGDGLIAERDPLEESYLWGFFDEEYQDYLLEEPNIRDDLDADFSGFVIQIGLRAYIF